MVNTAENAYRPDYVVTPGEVLAYELELRQMSQAELARRTGLTQKHINAIVKTKGKAVITPETALKLERSIGMPVNYWLNLEAYYQETQARLAETTRLEEDLDWLKKIPVAAMAQLGWLDKYRDKKDQLAEVLRFFGIASVAQWADMWPKLTVAYRQHGNQAICPEAVSAWLRQGEREAARIECAAFDKACFRTALDRVRDLTAEQKPERFVPAMKSLCAAAGVAVVFVPALPKTGVSGATRWVHPDKAVIQLSLRYKTNDHLWFTFFHEAGHIYLHGKKALFIEGGNGLDEAKEVEANQFAEHELIPKQAFAAFADRSPWSKAAIVAFARDIKLAPGVVVGRLQHKGLLPHTHCNDLKVRYQWANGL